LHNKTPMIGRFFLLQKRGRATCLPSFDLDKGKPLAFD
jgi:hypothetical protein